MTSVPELDSLAARATSSRSTSARREVLKYLREKRIRRSDLVVAFGGALLASGARLGNEVWDVREQLFLAYLDTHDLDAAEKVLATIERKFTRKSTRVCRLHAQLCEAAAPHTESKWKKKGGYAGAKREYAAVRKLRPNDMLTAKREVAMLRAQGKLPEALLRLSAFVDTFQIDGNAWHELAELNILMGRHREAAFCYEELITSAPATPVYHTKYAELLYTLGGSENVELARHHFAQSLTLQKDANHRALLGLLLCASSIKGSRGGSGGSGGRAAGRGAARGAAAAAAGGDDVNDDLLVFAETHISEIYAGTPTEALMGKVMRQVAS